jgi:hypothetical protein
VTIPSDFVVATPPTPSTHFQFPSSHAWKFADSKWTYVDELEYTRSEKDIRTFKQLGAVRVNTRSASTPQVTGHVAFAAVSARSTRGFDEEILFVSNKIAHSAKAAACLPLSSGPLLDASAAQAVIDTACTWIRNTHGAAARKQAAKSHNTVPRFFGPPRSTDADAPSGFSASGASPWGVKFEEGALPQALAQCIEQSVASSVQQMSAPIAAAGEKLSEAVASLSHIAAAFAHAQPAAAAAAHSFVQPPAEEPAAKRQRTASETFSELTHSLSAYVPSAAAQPLPLHAAAAAPGSSVLQIHSLFAMQALERSQLQATGLALQMLEQQSRAMPAAASAAIPHAAPESPAQGAAATHVQPVRVQPKRKSKKRKNMW